MLGTHYDREGNELDWERFILLFGDMRSRRIGKDAIGDYTVSTVWMGIDHNFSGDGPPLIFESMVFGPDKTDHAVRHYATETEAREGHAELVNEVSLLEAAR
jgi:hypothetical protein